MTVLGCPFCAPEGARIFHVGQLVLGLWDAFPASDGHALLVPKRHVEGWFEATAGERAELLACIDDARREIERAHKPDGYNVGINIGTAAGQTVGHLHVHVIPRYTGDVDDPRGGIRHVLPAKANYLERVVEPGSVAADRERVPTFGASAYGTPHERLLIAGGDDPLLPHVRAHVDGADRVDCAIAFVLESGLNLLESHLRDLLQRGGRLRIVTGDYLGVTEPNALLRLIDLGEAYPAQTTLRVFETASGESFHPKAYLFVTKAGDGTALVGSSNLTGLAFQAGIEWNARTVTSRDRLGFASAMAAFEALLTHPNVHSLDADWVDRYRARRPTLRSVPEREIAPLEERPAPPPAPHPIQERALKALEETRASGNSAGLVVLATGLGKTWLSAFDSNRSAFRRVLFVAHREEILRQALATFRRIRPTAHLGLFAGDEKTPDAEVVFASIQTLARKAHLERFPPDAFDYIVVDEFHHASAQTYRRVIDYFTPKFLLGLTATPERTDGGDLLALCQENLVFRCDLAEGIRRDLLAPFHYFGVPDSVDYANIPWRSSRFDEEALTRAVATRSRAQNALEQYRARGGGKTLAFCCSTRHADFMRGYFREAGLRAAAVHSDPSSDPRARSLELLEEGELDVIFAVDMFNEGIDLPNIDTVMMLRPTESRILWLQQFGRGLRKATGKTHLRVIDYIGNHRTFLVKPQTLFELPPGDAAVRDLLNDVQRGEVSLPPGCEVTYDLEAIEILRGLLRQTPSEELLRYEYEDFRQRNGRRPTALELHHEGFNPRALRKTHGSWLRFVDSMGDLRPGEQELIRAGRQGEFLSALEITPMTRSFKMLILLSMLQEERMPGEVSIDRLCEAVRRLARKSARTQQDLAIDLEDTTALKRLLETNPIAAWTGGRGTEGVAYFEYRDGLLRTTFTVHGERRSQFAELVRELADWRLGEYLDRPGGIEADATGILCRVSHSGDRPILFLPDRKKQPSIPNGWTMVNVDGEPYEANFVQVAINVIRRPGSEENSLPDILRRWFGEHAGRSGTTQFVVIIPGERGLEMRPAPAPASGGAAEVGRTYMRADIPPLFGLPFHSQLWQQGFVQEKGHMFLLVTLDKEGMPANHQYGDRFLSNELFEWKSQNRHTQESRAGQSMRFHAERNLPVHLFVRKQAKRDGKAAPFVYCGELDFVSWEGERPITVQWRLRTPLSRELGRLFAVTS